MKTRLKSLRKVLRLSQQEMADRLELSVTTMSRLEVGRLNITDRIVYKICREFNVSETWLRSGEGEISIAVTDEEENKLKREIIKSLFEINDDELDIFKEFMNSLN